VKKQYLVTANITISLHCVVEADSFSAAKDLAMNMELPSFCHQCSGGDATEQWCNSGEYDGEPVIVDVSES